MEGVKRSIRQGLYQVSTDLCLFAVGGFKTTFHLFIYVGKKRFDKFMSIPFFRKNVLEAAPLAILPNLRSLKLSTASASATAKLTELEVPKKNAHNGPWPREFKRHLKVRSMCSDTLLVLLDNTGDTSLQVELRAFRASWLRSTQYLVGRPRKHGSAVLKDIQQSVQPTDT